MGTPEFARKPLERLYEDGHDIAGVFTQADKPKNRGMKTSAGPVKELALSHGTPVFQPATLKDGEALRILTELRCDMITVVAYGKMLPKEILELPPFGCINIHGSLLPKYRGAAPIQHAIINGETETGVTSQYMAEEMDAGDILYTKKTSISETDTSADLFGRLSLLGAELLSETVFAVSSGEAVRIPQDRSEATYAPLLTREMSPVDWSDTPFNIRRKVNGLNPWPAASAVFDDVNIKIYAVDIREGATGHKNGDIISAGQHGLEIACSGGSVIIKEMQAPNGKRMSVAEYIRGRPSWLR